MSTHNYSLIVLCLAVIACGKKPATEIPDDSSAKAEVTVDVESYGTLSTGEEVNLYTFRNQNKMEVQIINYGGIITSIKVPDRTGVVEDVVLGVDSLKNYEKGTPFFGALVGRYGNRIAGASFDLDGTTFTLAVNNNDNHLHGGTKGFDKVLWSPEIVDTPEGPSLVLSYLSKDMEEGYPGNLSVVVTYSVTDDNQLKIDYKATTDKKTVVNLTNHSYFNLTGNAERDILEHVVTLNADQIVPVDEELIPTGELMPVEGTPFDFRQPKKVGEGIDADHRQIKVGGGYDHCWVLSSQDRMKHAATVYEPSSGRVMEVHTTEPGVQFYTGNFLRQMRGKDNLTYDRRYGLCLETEHFPDSPNQPDFPSVVVNPGEQYNTQTTFTFSTRE